MFGNFKKQNDDVYLIVGLGNPGLQYEKTRHNAGFLALDHLCKKRGEKIDRLKFKSLSLYTELAGKKVLFLKPQTFMNVSGEAVLQAVQFYKIPTERVIVIYDDISLDVGKMRVRRSGSHGGHNGIKSITQLIGSDAFARIKIGVGQKPNPDYDLADWVLSKFTQEEMQLLVPIYEKTEDALRFILQDKIEEAMNRCN